MTIFFYSGIINATMSKILVIGGSNIDTNYYVPSLPRPGESVHCVSERVSSLGGKGLNQATAAARAGGDVAFLGCIGNDEEGRRIERELSKETLSLHLQKVNAPTGSATILVEKSGENEVIVDSGANAYLDVSLLEMNIALFEACSFILLQNEMPFSSNEWIFRNYGEKKRIFYNPSPLCVIPNGLYPFLDTLIVNEIEAKTLATCPNSHEAAEKLLSFGAKRVLMTVGKHGSYLFEGNDVKYVKATNVPIVDTVGAGDTYAGYFVAALSKDYSMEKAMMFASLAAGMSVTKKGAFSSIPFAKDIGFKQTIRSPFE